MDLDTVVVDFDGKLKGLRKDDLTVLERANRGIALCRETLARLRTETVSHGFENMQQEIQFFKEIKSVPMQHLVYYTEVHQCELRMPQLGHDAKLDFLATERKRINRFFSCHIGFHRYLMEGRTDCDPLYFTREHGVFHPMAENYKYHYDTQFETSHDMLLATFKGLERYGRYLQELERHLEHLVSGSMDVPLEMDSPYTFTQSPTAAMEIIYAFRLAKFINHGDFEIKAFVEFFCRTFNIEIKDPYGLFKQIAQRKTDRAKHLQRLVNALLNALDDRDNYIP